MPTIALVGPPRTGKSTVFELLGGSATQGPLRAGFTPDRAMVPVPDPRFEKLCALFAPKKRTAVQIEIIDIPGISHEIDAKLRTVAFVEMRKADALAVVLNLFEPGAAEGATAALRAFWDEIVFADYAIVQKAVDAVQMAARSKHDPDAERRHTFLLSLLPCLESGDGLRRVDLDAEGEKLVRQYGLLTRKSLILAANLEEGQVASAGNATGVPELRVVAEERRWPLLLLSAKVEHEIAQIAPSERGEILGAYHLHEPGIDRFVRASYAALDLITFFTVGEDEVHGWTIRRGVSARKAAGTIHSDLERGFIRGEVISWSTLLACGSLAEAKKRGLLRLEGKDYPVDDGDILHVRFSV